MAEVDVSRASSLQAGKPVQEQARSQMGATFAERAAAAKGRKYSGPSPAARPASTFADRAKATRKVVSSSDAEDKAVTRSRATAATK